MASLQDAIKSHINVELSELYTCLPAKITAIKVLGSSTVVDVQILLNKLDNQNRPEVYQTIEDLPLQWPQSGGCFITTPLEIGDNVMVYFTMTNMSAWKNSDGVGPQTPRDKRRHNLNDGFAVPGVLPYQLGQQVDSEAVRISSGFTEIRVLKDGTIELGEGATERIIKGDAFKTLFDSLLAGLIAHTHPVSGSTAAASVDLTSAIASSFPGNVLPETTLSEVSKTK